MILVKILGKPSLPNFGVAKGLSMRRVGDGTDDDG